jgi:hypothetical protein
MLLRKELQDPTFYRNSMSLFLKGSPGIPERCDMWTGVLENVVDCCEKITDLLDIFYYKNSLDNYLTKNNIDADSVPGKLSKGGLIEIEGQEYRILKLNGTVAEVISMTSVAKFIRFGPQSVSQATNIYENSNLDTFLNDTWYNSLSNTLKNAIVPKTFTQDSWVYTDNDTLNVKKKYATISGQEYFGLVNDTFGASITRNVYAASIGDIIEYLGATENMTARNTVLTPVNVHNALIGSNPIEGTDRIWFRSADGLETASLPGVFISVTTGPTAFTTYYTGNQANVRAAFQVDLSKIDWTFTDNTASTENFLDTVAKIYGISRQLIIKEYYKDGTLVENPGSTQITLTNRELLIYIEAAIRKYIFDGTREALREAYYGTSLLNLSSYQQQNYPEEIRNYLQYIVKPSFLTELGIIYMDGENPASCKIALTGNESVLTDNITNLFLNGYLTIESVGIEYEYFVSAVFETGIFGQSTYFKQGSIPYALFG